MYMKLCKNVYNLNYLDIYFICVICNYYIKYKMIKQLLQATCLVLSYQVLVVPNIGQRQTLVQSCLLSNYVRSCLRTNPLPNRSYMSDAD